MAKSMEMKPLAPVSHEDLFGDILGESSVVEDGVSEAGGILQPHDAEVAGNEKISTNGSREKKNSRRKVKICISNCSQHNGKPVHFTIDIPVDFHARMREYAYKHNDTIHNLVLKAVDIHLKKLKI